MERNIIHLDLDAFFVGVERRRDSSLMGKPVLIGGSPKRGVVAACSYEARRYGIHSAMPMQRAIRLCPHAVVLRGDINAYSQAKLRRSSPVQHRFLKRRPSTNSILTPAEWIGTSAHSDGHSNSAQKLFTPHACRYLLGCR